MESTGDFVRRIIEFASRMQHSHDHFGGGPALFGVNVHRYTSPVVGNGYGLICVDRDDNSVAKAGKCLINGVIYNFKDHVVQTGTVIGVSDVHSGAFSDSVEPF